MSLPFTGYTSCKGDLIYGCKVLGLNDAKMWWCKLSSGDANLGHYGKCRHAVLDEVNHHILLVQPQNFAAM